MTRADLHSDRPTEPLEVQVEEPSSVDARACLQAYFAELAARFEGGFDPARANPLTEQELTPPAGYFIIARLEGRPVGCGALKITETKVGEIKRMWTSGPARGRGIAGKIIGALEEIARGVGVERLRLDTNKALEEAHEFYRRRGYREVERFNDDPYAHLWFEKRL
jgi:GNAT superfamily N-acetyltransferase